MVEQVDVIRFIVLAIVAWFAGVLVLVSYYCLFSLKNIYFTDEYRPFIGVILLDVVYCAST